MTFKHVKFGDSPTMRALEKVAYEKGLVKPENIQKSASVSKKLDITPSTNLMENIFKLCAGLRAQGLEKVAVDLEQNYLDYKQAQTLYETSKEKGEDLVDAAHPDGSHKLENVEGDEACFETILDVHVKHLQMLDKKPTGKLSNANQIISAVKTVLAQGLSEDTIKELIRKFMAAANYKWNELDNLIIRDGKLIFSRTAYNANALNIKRNFMESTSVSNIDAILRDLNGVNVILSFVNEEIRPAAKQLLGNVRSLLESAKYQLSQLHNSQAGIATTPKEEAHEDKTETNSFAKLFQQINGLKNKVASWKAIGAIANNQQAMQWINEEVKALDNIANRYGKIENEEQRIALVPNMQKEVYAEMVDITNFENKWIRA